MWSDHQSNILLENLNAYGEYEETVCRFIDNKKQRVTSDNLLKNQLIRRLLCSHANEGYLKKNENLVSLWV